MAEFRQCVHCGRKGTRMFVVLDRGNARCRATRACALRRRRWNNRFRRRKVTAV